MGGRPDSEGRASPCSRHIVHIFDCVDELAVSAADFLASSFDHGGSAIAIATPAHRSAIAAELASRGCEISRARATGTYRELDAAAVVSTIITDGSLDRVAFDAILGSLIDNACRFGGPVLVFGEMVDLLWKAGRRSAALTLERLWNDLAGRYPFSLYCAYTLRAVADGRTLDGAKAICDAHSEVVTPASYALGLAPGSGQRDETHRSAFLLPVPLAPRAARWFVADTLAAWGAVEFSDQASLIASELATNALVHARSPFEVSVTRSTSGVRVSVRDASDVAPTRTRTTSTHTGGRGLAIVASVSRRWGAEAAGKGKVTWAEL